jgi:hypothetical protein
MELLDTQLSLQLIMMERMLLIQLLFGRITVELLRRTALAVNTSVVTVNVLMDICSGESLRRVKCIPMSTELPLLVRSGLSTLGTVKLSL